MKKAILPVILAVVTATAVAGWLITHPDMSARNEVVLYGNVDLRQVNMAFNASERIDTVLVQEGDKVEKGQVLGMLDMERLKASVAGAEARVQAQTHVVERLENGTRPEEIDQAKANLNAAQADFSNAKRNYDWIRQTAGSGASSRQDMENAKAAFEIAEAKLRVNQKALDLAVIGPRKEDIAEAHAVLRGDEADLAVARQQLGYATLVCPSKGVVQNRLLEPGEMASPQRPVLNIAITDPKWVRAYLPERDLGKVKLGMKAAVSSDSFPGKEYQGWVGFISPVAEFTPKSVETTELRTALMYEVRIFVTDPFDELRLGMPASVKITSARGNNSGKPDQGR